MRGIPRRYCSAPDCGCDDIEAETCTQRREAPPRQSGASENHLIELYAALNEAPLPRSWTPADIARDTLLAERQQAHSRGAAAAALGLPRDTNPHPEGTALWISWNAGWKEAVQ